MYDNPFAVAGTEDSAAAVVLIIYMVMMIFSSRYPQLYPGQPWQLHYRQPPRHQKCLACLASRWQQLDPRLHFRPVSGSGQRQSQA